MKIRPRSFTPFIFCLVLYFFSTVYHIQAQSVPERAIQIKTALLAAPESTRDGAKVYGYDQNGKFIILRNGSNEMICIADDPASNGFSTSCYHKDLEPFMARGRELKEQQKSFKEIFDIREAEAKNGKLKMPKNGATLYVLTAAAGDFDMKSGEIRNPYLRYVVYIPWATQESTGLPLSPESPGMPWIMDPGTHRAHIMINPPKN